MSSSTSTQPRLAQLACALMLVAAVSACTRPPEAGSPSSAQSQPPFTAARRDLSQDESAGGHTLRKHVGRTDAELRERLRHEREISAASTWNNRESAEAAVGAAIAQQSSKISKWLERDSHANLVLDYAGDSARPFGRTMHRNTDYSVPCAQAVIVLKFDPPNSYHVLTAYPECR